MIVLILGGDGYLGWPTAMYFSVRGHEVIAVDNYFRRKAALDLDCESLIPTPNLVQRASRWKESSGKDITVYIRDVTHYEDLKAIFSEHHPDVVIHYAEQPSAPYSMLDREKAALTIQNNLISTLNIAYAVRDCHPFCHIVKIGVMGEYGRQDGVGVETPWMEEASRDGKDRLPLPRQASSLYHSTRIHDTDLLFFYVRKWGMRSTVLMQGIVYGVLTEESQIDESLLPDFHYDAIFGTAVNRCVVQVIAGHVPSGYEPDAKARSYMNLSDTLQCVYLAAANPPEQGDPRLYRQVAETFSFSELSQRVRHVGSLLGYKVQGSQTIRVTPKGRTNNHDPIWTGCLKRGLKPHPMTENVIEQIFRTVEPHKDRINVQAMLRA